MYSGLLTNRSDGINNRSKRSPATPDPPDRPAAWPADRPRYAARRDDATTHYARMRHDLCHRRCGGPTNRGAVLARMRRPWHTCLCPQASLASQWPTRGGEGGEGRQTQRSGKCGINKVALPLHPTPLAQRPGNAGSTRRPLRWGRPRPAAKRLRRGRANGPAARVPPARLEGGRGPGRGTVF